MSINAGDDCQNVSPPDPVTDQFSRERRFSDAPRSFGHLIAARLFTADRAAVFGASRKGRYYFFPKASMTQFYNLIASFVHGNAVGVILEPNGVREQFEADQWPQTWQVRIGPLAPEAAIGAEYPSEDYTKVVADLVEFCRKHGIECPAGEREGRTE